MSESIEVCNLLWVTGKRENLGIINCEKFNEMYISAVFA